MKRIKIAPKVAAMNPPACPCMDQPSALPMNPASGAPPPPIFPSLSTATLFDEPLGPFDKGATFGGGKTALDHVKRRRAGLENRRNYALRRVIYSANTAAGAALPSVGWGR